MLTLKKIYISLLKRSTKFFFYSMSNEGNVIVTINHLLREMYKT